MEAITSFRGLLNTAKGMQHTLCVQVRRVCQFLGIKTANTPVPSFNADLRLPFVSSFVKRHAEEIAAAVMVCSVKVLVICLMGRLTKIGNRVVHSISINMVNLLDWPIPIHVQPRKPMGLVFFVVNAYRAISTPSAPTSNPSRFSRVTPAWVSGKDSCIFVVVKQFAQACCGKTRIVFSHDTVPSLIGQRPARVISTGGLRYFNSFAIKNEGAR